MPRNLLRRALEGEFVDVSSPPETDDNVMVFRNLFGSMANAAGADGASPTEAVSWVLEEQADGTSAHEKEHTLYAKLPDQSGLKGASSMEHQEQWELRIPKTDQIPGEGAMRVRKTWADGTEGEYTRATKIRVSDDDKIEMVLASNHNEFLAFRFIAPQGMIKDRYHFPVTGTDLVWQVDMFPKEGGGYHPWCKIDLEVDDLDAALPELPLDFEDVILPKRFKKIEDAEWEAQVTKLYDDYFLTKNVYVSGKIATASGQPSPDQPATGEGGGVVVPSGDAPQADAPDVTPETPSEGEEGKEGDEAKPKEPTDAEANAELGVSKTAEGSDDKPAAKSELDDTKQDEEDDEEEKEEKGNPPQDASRESSGSDNIQGTGA